MSVTVVDNFDEIAIRGPRPGFFVGDCVEGSTNPIVKHYELSQEIPMSPQLLPLGSLTPLPIEILHVVLSLLNVQSVLKFRRVNTQCAAVVLSSHDFNIVMSFPKAMSAVVTMQCQFYSLGRLATCLSDTRCNRCEDHFGELLYLITAERVCWSCWRRFKEFIPKASNRRDIPESSDEHLELIPHINAVRGKYGIPFPFALIKSSGRLFDRYAVIAELEKLQAAAAMTGKGVEISSDPDPEPWRARFRTPESAEAAALLGKDFQIPNNLRYTTFLRAPYFDQEVQEYVGGYFCRACIGRNTFSHITRYSPGWQFPGSIWHEPWRRYTREGFWKHVSKYGKVLKSDLDGHFTHDSVRGEKQTPDDVQWEMYRYEEELLAEGMELRDDRSIPFVHNGKEIPHNCQ